MRTLLALLSLLACGTASADALRPNDDIYVCVRKPERGYASSWDLVMLKKTQGVVVYQNSSNGNETDEITAMGMVGSKLVVQHQNGTKETVTFDLPRGNASWSEDAYPSNTQLYTDCKSFRTYDYDTIRAWFSSVVETAEWERR